MHSSHFSPLRPTGGAAIAAVASARLVIYGAISLIAIAFGGFPIHLLVPMPIVVVAILAVLVAPAVLELPFETTPAGSGRGRIAAALVTVQSTTGLLVAALFLTGAAMALLLARLMASGGGVPRLLLIHLTPADPPWLGWLLAIGLAMGVGIVVGIRRGSASPSSTGHGADATDSRVFEPKASTTASSPRTYSVDGLDVIAVAVRAPPNTSAISPR